MSTSGGTARSRTRRWYAWLGVIIALAIALSCAVVPAAYHYSADTTDAAYAAIHPADEDDQANSQKSMATAAGEQDEGEQIEDEDNPMSSGLGSGEPVAASGGMDTGITIAVIMGIIGVVAFFAFKTGRLSSSIRKMNDTFK